MKSNSKITRQMIQVRAHRGTESLLQKADTRFVDIPVTQLIVGNLITTVTGNQGPGTRGRLAWRERRGNPATS